jgi:hypothetical protein
LLKVTVVLVVSVIIILFQYISQIIYYFVVFKFMLIGDNNA